MSGITEIQLLEVGVCACVPVYERHHNTDRLGPWDRLWSHRPRDAHRHMAGVVLALWDVSRKWVENQSHEEPPLAEERRVIVAQFQNRLMNSVDLTSTVGHLAVTLVQSNVPTIDFLQSIASPRAFYLFGAPDTLSSLLAKYVGETEELGPFAQSVSSAFERMLTEEHRWSDLLSRYEQWKALP